SSRIPYRILPYSTMLLFFLGLALLSTSTLADSPLYIEELEDLVYGPDRRILDVLDDDNWTPRSELKVKVDEILARQSPEIQKAYAHIVEMKEGQRNLRNKYWQTRAEAAGAGPQYEKIKLLQTDMSITEHEAERRTRQFWFEMNIYHGSGSSEEYYYPRYMRSEVY
ncbi:hypothetical protein PMAYCL1PPCAC_28167, partial [Pristionchus mayeri]